MGNTDTRDDSLDSALTARGREQVAVLGEKWKNVRIDHLYASDLVRARDTAEGIASVRTPRPRVYTMGLLREHEVGQYARQLLAQGRQREYGYAMGGTDSNGNMDRKHRPAGGESLDEVARRVELMVSLLVRHAVRLREPPIEFVDKTRSQDVERLPEGVPHVVLASHNVYLLEFYEFMMAGFDLEVEHRWTKSLHYRNTDWYVVSGPLSLFLWYSSIFSPGLAILCGFPMVWTFN